MVRPTRINCTAFRPCWYSVTTSPLLKPLNAVVLQVESIMPTVPVAHDFEHGIRLSTDDSAIDDTRLSSQVVEVITQAGHTPEELLKLPLSQPPELDDEHPLPAYYVSSSHNTYLLSRQIFASSSAASYTHVLTHGGRCVEIDAWDSSDGPIVTHGYAFTQSISFRSVCEAIGAAVGPNDLPIMVSLECHASPSTQETMVRIMLETWGDKLVQAEVEGIEGMVSLKHVRGRILLMVEWYSPASRAPPQHDSSSSSSSSSDDDDRGDQRQRDIAIAGEQAQKQLDSRISPSLAKLGVYAKSVKPQGDFTSQKITEPLHCLLNISENALSKLLPTRLEALIQMGHTHQTRVYPRGTRVQSTNLNPLKAWRAGAQIAALNWQSYDLGMQLNHAMFNDTGGWVLKSEYQRGLISQASDQSTRKLTIRIYGASNLPHPEDTQSDDSVSVYIRAELMHHGKDQKYRTKTVKGAPSRESTHNSLDIMWDETFTWDITSDDLAFIRFVVVEDKFAFDEPFMVYCARLSYVKEGLRLANLRDLTGRRTGSTILVTIEWC
ncbi:PLC-like phosphodiesterase [Rhizoctonia solani]|nr:PLC-like phosphodiesterase [Rhizoctonia solani]